MLRQKFDHGSGPATSSGAGCDCGRRLLRPGYIGATLVPLASYPSNLDPCSSHSCHRLLVFFVRWHASSLASHETHPLCYYAAGFALPFPFPKSSLIFHSVPERATPRRSLPLSVSFSEFVIDERAFRRTAWSNIPGCCRTTCSGMATLCSSTKYT